ncbi:hypothetical protein ACP4OV_001571 [Aristida adscensionis]
MNSFKNMPRATSETMPSVWLFIGLFLALVIFFAVSLQSSIFGPNKVLTGPSGNEGKGPAPVVEEDDHLPAAPVNRTKGPDDTKQVHEEKWTSSPKNFTAIPSGSVPPHPLKPICNLSDPRYDGCEMWGDARTATAGNTSQVFFIPPPAQLAAAEAATWRIRPQSRKVVAVREVVVRSLNLSDLGAAPSCTVRRSVPAVVFALDGLTLNCWHAFSDVLVPLFTTARAFGGEVELVATHSDDLWFVGKYRRIFGALSRYRVVALGAGGEVRCYRHLIVGLRGHRDLDIDPARTPQRYDMLAFRLFVREAYALPPPAAALPCKSGGGGGGKPRMMIILRAATRRFVNADAVLDAVEAAGFEVVRMEPTDAADMDAVAREVDACDAVMGAHGAGLTNMVFLRTGGVVVQVIPWGVDPQHFGEGYFGSPAASMGVRHIAYSITAEESTLYDKYGKDHPVITDPDMFYRNGMDDQLYWREQNIRLDTVRIVPTLEKVKQLLQE